MEVNGEATLEQEQQFKCPRCHKKFKQLVSLTGEVTLYVEPPDRDEC
jgi:hypothetical protein